MKLNIKCNKKKTLSILVLISVVWMTDIYAASKKVALVIGIANYQDFPLSNPTNDAEDMSLALTSLNFDVDFYSNLNRSQMRQAIRTFGEKLKRADVGLFYFAGHGIQIKGRNYLVPLEADVRSEDEVQDEGIDAGSVLRKMETAGNGVNIVILDACRNNPFARSFRSLNQGLARMDGPVGSFIAYATSPGSVAADGSGRNGIYTKHLLQALKQPGLTIEQTFKRVRNAVMNDTQSKQIPWESSSLMGEFVFRPSNDDFNTKQAIHPTPQPPAANKYLQVITNVPNAAVFVNNEQRGYANKQGILNIENIFESQVEVTVKANGYQIAKSQVDLVPDQWQQLSIQLAPESASQQEVSNHRQTSTESCLQNKRAMIATKVKFLNQQQKTVVKKNIPELNIMLMQSFKPYGLQFSEKQAATTTLKKWMNQLGFKTFKLHYLVKLTSSLSETPIKVVKTNMKSVSGDVSLELIDATSRQILASATQAFNRPGLDRQVVLRNAMNDEIPALTTKVINQLCQSR